MFKRNARTGRVTGYTEFDALGRPTKRFHGESRPHGEADPPFILEPRSGKGRAPGCRARESRGQTSCRLATGDPMALDEEALIRRLQRRFSDRDTTDFRLLDFIYAEGSPVDALLYSSLFWPELLAVDGAILLRATVEDDDELARVRAVVRERGPAETERRFNLWEFSNLFGNGLADIGDDEAELLMTRLAEMWRCRLHARFPGRRFVLEVLAPEDTGGDIAILFYQGER